MPHMLNTATEYTSLIQGLNPDPKKHDIFLELEPNTGTPLHGMRRVQFNMFVRKIDQIDVTRNLKTVLMPILWIDEGVELNDEFIKLLNDSLIRTLFFLDIFVWALIIGGIISGLIMCYMYYKDLQTMTTTIPPAFTQYTK